MRDSRSSATTLSPTAYGAATRTKEASTATTTPAALIYLRPLRARLRAYSTPRTTSSAALKLCPPTECSSLTLSTCMLRTPVSPTENSPAGKGDSHYVELIREFDKKDGERSHLSLTSRYSRVLPSLRHSGTARKLTTQLQHQQRGIRRCRRRP